MKKQLEPIPAPADLKSTSADSKSMLPRHRRLGVEFAIVLVLLAATTSLLFIRVFSPDQTLFSNDGPLGKLMAQCHQLPSRFTGSWNDLNVLGTNEGIAPPSISMGLQYLLHPIIFSKLYALLAVIILGLGAWCLFVNLHFSPPVCMLGALAAALNSCFFSVACWGVAAQTINTGMIFFALAALTDDTSRWRWLRAMLAGLAVGMGVMEGADVGAIYSLYVAAFILYQAWVGEGTPSKKAALGIGRVFLVAMCAALVAAPVIFSLVKNDIVDVVGTQQDAQTKAARWDWATQWSLPIKETTGFMVSGLFGYRMDSPDGGAYWGEVGRDPSMERYLANGRIGPAPHGFIRFAGGGFYAGVIVILLAAWAMAQSLRGKSPVFTRPQQKWIWFWMMVVMVSLLLSFGRFAPFYRMIYALPYFSAIRNPVKFIYPVSLALVLIFAYGLDGFLRRHARHQSLERTPRNAQPKAPWKKTDPFERRWIIGCGIFLAIIVIAWGKYYVERQSLVDYLQTVQFNFTQADMIAGFSLCQVAWFVFTLILAGGLMAGFILGKFAGSGARWGILLTGLVLVADLTRANLPWVTYWNYAERYAGNALIDRLCDRPYEHRVAALSWAMTPKGQVSLNQVYYEWLQGLFPYYNVQTLDVAAMPRVNKELRAFATNFNTGGSASLLPVWRLTNARYILGPAEALDSLIRMAGNQNNAFSILMRFNLVPRPGVKAPEASYQLTVQPDDNGANALFEFNGALPRAKLFAGWQCLTNDQTLLQRLCSEEFRPDEQVLISGELPEAATASETESDNSTVSFISYAPKDIVLKCNAPRPTVLLLNDQYDPAWEVRVDGQTRQLLRCNFLMRGVYLPAGAHTVEFRFRLPIGLSVLSLSAILLGMLLLTTMLLSRRMAAGIDLPRNKEAECEGRPTISPAT